MTSQSPDLFLEEVNVVVFFLEDALIQLVSNYDSKGKVYESGDLISISRSDDCETEQEPAVVLGFGGTNEAVKLEARTYFRRVVKWHNLAYDCEFYGHSLHKVKEQSQVDVFSTSDEDSDKDSDETDFSGAEDHPAVASRTVTRSMRTRNSSTSRRQDS